MFFYYALSDIATIQLCLRRTLVLYEFYSAMCITVSE